MEVVLYNKNEHLVTLHSYYHKQETIEQLLFQAGFQHVVWHEPVISEQGLKDLGEAFWEGYEEQCDLAYVTANK